MKWTQLQWDEVKKIESPFEDEYDEYPKLYELWDEPNNIPVKAGLLVKTVNDRIMLIGNLNQSGGSCGCCQDTDMRIKEICTALMNEEEK